MLKDNKQGIWVKEDNCFYYLETGRVQVGDELGRVMNTLISRGKKVYQAPGEELSSSPPTKRMTYADAKERGCKVEPIYLNKFIKDQFVDTQTEKD